MGIPKEKQRPGSGRTVNVPVTERPPLIKCSTCKRELRFPVGVKGRFQPHVMDGRVFNSIDVEVPMHAFVTKAEFEAANQVKANKNGQQ